MTSLSRRTTGRTTATAIAAGTATAITSVDPTPSWRVVYTKLGPSVITTRYVGVRHRPFSRSFSLEVVHLWSRGTRGGGIGFRVARMAESSMDTRVRGGPSRWVLFFRSSLVSQLSRAFFMPGIYFGIAIGGEGFFRKIGWEGSPGIRMY